MPNDISLLGIGPNAPPNVYGQINFATGSQSAGNSVYSILLLGNMAASGGTATTGTLYGPDTPITLQSKQDAQNLFGNCTLKLMYQDAVSVNPVSRIYCMAVPTASGTAASATLTVVVGSAAQTAGVVRVTLGTVNVDVPIGSTDVVGTIATNITNAINSQTNVEVSATVSGAVITITYNTIGARGNTFRMSAQILSGSNVTLTVAAGSFTATSVAYTGVFNLTSGAGSDLTGYQACVSNIIASGQRFYKVVLEAANDSYDGYSTSGTGNGIPAYVASSLIDFCAQPAVGLRQCMFTASNDTLAHTVSAVTAINDPRSETINLKNCDVVPGRLAAQWAAIKALFETPFLNAGGVNFDNFGATTDTQGFWTVPAPRDGSSPSVTDISIAVVSGVTILKVMPGGRTKVVKSCTNKFQTNGNFDPRIVDMGKVTICDYFLDDLVSALNNGYKGCLVQDDVPNVIPAPKIVTPSIARNTVVAIINLYADAGLINGPLTLAGLVVNRQQNPTSRIGVQVPLYTADCLHSFTVLVNQSS
jgi:phage tail sheath gpL-like